MPESALYPSLVAFGARPGVFCGATTAASFGNPENELQALLGSAGVYDLGWRSMLVVTGSDRVRWLNGMVTNNTRDLAPNHGNYNFVLNAQGKIQGDLAAYNRGEYLLLVTSADQASKLREFLDRYIIMDDVEITDITEKLTSIGIAGPRANASLAKVGMQFPTLEPGQTHDLDWNNLGLTVVRGYGEYDDNYEIWMSPENAPQLWTALTDAGAAPAGFEALELARILRGVPRYGVDITERYLPQETAQFRALHFAKGCYIGQEIVERIRSRALLHRTFAGFEIEGPPPAKGSPVMGPEKQVGEITSAAAYSISGKSRTFALGYIRTELSAPGSRVTVNGAPAYIRALPFEF